MIACSLTVLLLMMKNESDSKAERPWNVRPRLNLSAD